MKKLSLLFVFLTAGIGSIAQDENNGYNPLSTDPIHESDIMYKKSIIRRIRLDEKQNLPFFAKSAELSRIIIDAVKQEKLLPYRSDSCVTTMTKEEFVNNIRDRRLDIGVEDTMFASQDEEEWGDEEGPAVEIISDEYFPKDLYILDLREDVIFDKERSRMYFDMLTFTMIIPADNTLKGFDEPVASFKYKDLIEIFRQDDRAVYHNALNDAEQINFADAIKLRLFSSYITKVSNPKDEFLSDIHGGADGGINASRLEMYKLFEYEHNLWEY